MRDTINVVDFYFPPSGVPQTPARIVVHRQGNPGAHASDAIAWGMRTGAFTIHEYIEDHNVYHCQHWDQLAYHVKEAKVAEQRGYRVNGPAGRRGDYDAIGIETVDLPGGAPGQLYSLSQETRISLVLRLRDICSITGLGVETIDEHGSYDPVNRPEDLGDAINIEDLREDVRDLMAGREPWRTVQQFATGKRAPESWKPLVAPPPPVATKKQQIIDQLNVAQAELNRARALVETI
jgi:hypothetical protein